jgi:predicted nuclease with TOPRIM domain
MSVMIDGNFTQLVSSMNGLEQRLNVRIDQLEARMDRLEARMDRLEMRMDQLEARFDSFKLELENMFNRKMVQFLYMQIGISLALFSAMFTALYFSLGALVSAG